MAEEKAADFLDGDARDFSWIEIEKEKTTDLNALQLKIFLPIFMTGGLCTTYHRCLKDSIYNFASEVVTTVV